MSKKIVLSVVAVFLFLGHLWFVYHYPDPFCVSTERRDFEGLSWVITYIFSLVIYLLAKYHKYNLDIPISCYVLSIICGALLIIWDVYYYIRKDILSSFIIYSFLMVIFIFLIFHTLKYSPMMALVQLPIILRTLFIYVGDCDKLFL